MSIHILISIVFLLWYFCFDGYLGNGYGELVYILAICGVFMLSLLILLFYRKTIIYMYGIELLLFLYYIWFFQLFNNVLGYNSH